MRLATAIAAVGAASAVGTAGAAPTVELAARGSGFVFTYLNGEVAATYAPLLLKGLGTTVVLSAAVLATGFAVGLLLVLLRAGGGAAGRLGVQLWGEAMRALPPLVVIVLLYFALPLLGLSLSAALCTWLALSAVLAAYVQDGLWGALLSLPRGQAEAARATGMRWGAVMRHVLLPQALRQAAPALGNRALSTVKATALGSVVAVSEVLSLAQSAVAESANPTPLTLAALAYLALLLPGVWLTQAAWRAWQRRARRSAAQA